MRLQASVVCDSIASRWMASTSTPMGNTPVMTRRPPSVTVLSEVSTCAPQT